MKLAMIFVLPVVQDQEADACNVVEEGEYTDVTDRGEADAICVAITLGEWEVEAQRRAAEEAELEAAKKNRQGVWRR